MATIVLIERVIWKVDDVWNDAVSQLAERFARAAPLDTDAVLLAGTLAEQLMVLESWASAADVDLDRELGRWLDERLSMHVRPDPLVTRRMRALATQGELHGASALPLRAAESVARHAGCLRSFTALHGGVRTDQDLTALVAALGDATILDP